MLVDIKNLQISFETRTSRFDAVRGISLQHANQLPLRNLHIRQLTGAELRQELAVRHGLGRWVRDVAAGYVKRYRDGNDVQGCESPSMLLLSIHHETFLVQVADQSAFHWNAGCKAQTGRVSVFSVRPLCRR